MSVDVGAKFGRLTVLAVGVRVGQKPGVRCKCDCGALVDRRLHSVTSGNTRSCGCLSIENRKQKATRHGHASNIAMSATYKTWQAMKQRCGDSGRADYGARGIRVCDRWRDSFAAFLEDMGARPDGRTLDRIDNDGNYEPSNCRWATVAEQMHNRRDTKLSTEDMERIQRLVADGARAPQIAAEYQINGAYARRLVQRYREKRDPNV